MRIHISNYEYHLNVTLCYGCFHFHLINTIMKKIMVNGPIKDDLTELPLLPLLPLALFTLSVLLLLPLFSSLVFASSRFGPLHLSVQQQVVYKKINRL